MKPTTLLSTLAILTLATSALAETPNYFATLLADSKAPPRFAAHTPAFTVSEQTFSFHEVKGPTPTKLWVIKDGEKFVALYHPGMGQLDLITTDPTKSPAELKLPSRYHWATLLGTRIQTIPWAYGWAPTGDIRTFAFTNPGKTLTLTEKQEWKNKKDGSPRAKSEHVVTLALNPVTGYTVTINAAFATKDGNKRNPELCNIVPQKLADPFSPAFNKLVYTPEADPLHPVGWLNNSYIGERTNKDKNLLKIANGGFFAWLSDPDGWGQVFTRSSPKGSFNNATCNVWLDQHNIFNLPDDKDSSGMFAGTATFTFTSIPPEAVKLLESQSKLLDFANESLILVNLTPAGEDFESQPLPVASSARGAWIKDGEIDSTTGYGNSKKSLLIKGKPDGKLTKYDFFSITPQIPLEANTRYRLEALVKVEGENTTAFLGADFYDNSPHEDARFQKQHTPEITAASSAAEKDGWQKTSLDFDSGPVGPFIDLRFIVLGPGRAWFDNFKLTKLPPTTAAQ